MRVRASPKKIEFIHQKRPDIIIKTTPNGEYMIEGIDDSQFVDFLKAQGLSLEQQETTLVIKEFEIKSATEVKPASIPPPLTPPTTEPATSPTTSPSTIEPAQEQPKAKVYEHFDQAFAMIFGAMIKPQIDGVEAKVQAAVKEIKALSDRHDTAKLQLEASIANVRNLLTEIKTKMTSEDEKIKTETQTEITAVDQRVTTLADEVTKFVAIQETVNNAAKVTAQNNVDEHRKIQENLASTVKHFKNIPLPQ